MLSSAPPAEGTLPQAQNNCIFLTFDKAITVGAGEMLSIVACPGGADVSASFTYSVEPDGVTLKAAENGPVLTNQTWYRVTEGNICVAPFTLDVCTLLGDTNGDGTVMALDLGMAWGQNGQAGPCLRADTNGDGTVMALDLGMAWGQNGQSKPAKVCP